jgi:hypothetical protein
MVEHQEHLKGNERSPTTLDCHTMILLRHTAPALAFLLHPRACCKLGLSRQLPCCAPLLHDYGAHSEGKVLLWPQSLNALRPSHHQATAPRGQGPQCQGEYS